MPHHRSRHAEGLIQKALSYSPCVGILGMRQVGKSTLLQEFSKTYYTFDDERFLIRFEREGHGLIETASSPLGLDEIQKYPPVFDALKLSIDQRRRPGRFLVSGSVRFGSRRQIRESLTGRIVLVELMPFTLSECHRRPASGFLEMLKTLAGDRLVQVLSRKAWAFDRHVLHYLQTGGLPGICFRREEAVREDFWAAHLETLFARDIHLVRRTTLSVNRLISFLTELSAHQGFPMNVSQLARVANVSVPTAGTILASMEALFLIRPYGSTWFIEDAGLSHHLRPVSTRPSRQDMIRLVHSEFRSQIGYQRKFQASLAPYQTRGGSDIPFLVQFKSGKKIAVIVEEEDVPSNKSLKSLVWTKKRFPDIELLILLNAPKAFETTNGIPCLPWTWIF